MDGERGSDCSDQITTAEEQRLGWAVGSCPVAQWARYYSVAPKNSRSVMLKNGRAVRNATNNHRPIVNNQMV